MSLKLLVVGAIVIGAVALYAGHARQQEAQRDRLAADAAALTKEYGATLLGALQGAMESSGPAGAVAFCHDQAPGIATDISRRSGWTIARTSLKPRNTASAPDDYERRVMNDFAAQIAAGTPAAALSRAEIVTRDGQRMFRFVKAIPTGDGCLGCHGTEIKREVEARIDALYPDDRATGFKTGDMRGVFTLRKPL